MFHVLTALIGLNLCVDVLAFLNDRYAKLTSRFDV